MTCENDAVYAACVGFTDELSCRLQFCPMAPTANELMVEDGTGMVIAPVAFPGAARFYLDDLAACWREQGGRLGYQGIPPLRRRIVQVADGARSRSYYAAWGPGAGVGVIVTEGDAPFLAMIEDLYGDGPRAGCLDPHEVTHAIVGALPMPRWLNEGLAVAGNAPSLLCLDHGAVYGDETIAYAGPLDAGAPMLSIYITAACFWTLADAALGPVLDSLAAKDGDFNFIAGAMGRPDLRDWTLETFGFYDVHMTKGVYGWDETYMPR